MDRTLRRVGEWRQGLEGYREGSAGLKGWARWGWCRVFPTIQEDPAIARYRSTAP